MSKKSLALCAVQLFLLGAASAQQVRITGRIDNTARTTLAGHLRSQANAANDRGQVSPSLQMSYMTLNLSQTAQQQADLQQLLTAQQTPGSAEYHHWLTPEQFADRFGASQADISTVSGWLQSQGLNVISVARGRTWIAFSGTAAQVASAFQLEIHQYQVNGEMHYANASEPSVPSAFNGVVRGVRGMSDFRMKPKLRAKNISPMYTASDGEHFLAPNDISTIYDVNPLYSAGISGSGQSLAIAGQTAVNVSDIQTFRSNYGLPANNPTMMLVPGERSPGISSSDLPEADLDLEWSGAIARNATIIFVYAQDVMTAVQYAIDQNVAPVVSVSYGDCELDTGSQYLRDYQTWGQQANAQGITWFAPAGDDGAADCSADTNLTTAEQAGLAVDAPGSTPEVTSVGGTEFVEGGGNYWSATNSSTGASALSYIPETTWNDGCSAQNGCSATGGGASTYFSKPTWQTGTGVPADNSRDVPDIALSTSANHDGYLIYSGGQLQVVGGTSVSTPQFAGIAALLNQYLVANGAQSTPGLGNINPQLYAMAASTSNVFHDITTGNNIVTVAASCPPRSILCSPTTYPAVGYTAHAGYNQSTGWGSVDIGNLVTQWNGSSSGTQPTQPTQPASSVTMNLIANLTTVGSNDILYLIATATSSNSTTPTGVVSFSGNGSNLGTATLVGSGGTATATIPITGDELQAGMATISATYSGGGSSASATVNVTVVAASVASGTPTISAGGLVNAASYAAASAPGGLLSVFGSTLSPATQTATSIPLPYTMSGISALVNGVAAPLSYVSGGLVNLQIPYEVNAGSATVSINNNGQVTTGTFTLAAAGPGIFMDSNMMVVPTNTASTGQPVAVYFTGAGAVTPAVADGTAPTGSTNLPAPVATITVTVGGVAATVNYVGLTPGSVGVTQVNFTVPSGVAAGKQPVVVTAGSAKSAAAYLTVSN